MKILFTFPGQGAQRPGMLQALPDGETWLNQASDVLQEDVRQLDTSGALRHTRSVQLCLLISGVAYARTLIAQGIQPDFVSGLSIGAFPAAVVSGALRFDDALRLVALRGDLMEQAWPQGYGLTVIIGLTQRQLEPLLGECYLANINAEKQMVIAGRDEAMTDVARLAREKGARRTCRLAVSVPSHCALLQEPATRLLAAFQRVQLKPPTHAYLSGSSGRVLWKPDRIQEDLAMNMARTVHWHEAMIAANEREVGLAIEMPPGSTLSGLTGQAFQYGEAIALEQSGIPLAITLAQRARLAR
ncbi:malonate decarboxylase subunit epsilon [[Pantoea] beijingensis]|uniref:Malonyl CoA-acyl carrier protein transacylase n=1 Tax=[Pantoea] beijingensis TaxID=1324864 RepID=A0A443IBW9_9GAMM|nr:malonate decarboxylase subunit epsilon [[Pantoea] beijingensis]RWR01367.1 malonate decarboxylase subunit epsilon [[Pantoea] beijingensis]